MITIDDLPITKDKIEAKQYLQSRRIELSIDDFLPVYRRFITKEINDEIMDEIIYNLRQAYEY
jgi:hypothetical protein